MLLSTEALTVGEASREFVLAAPSSYRPERPYALVLALHGDGGDGPSIQAALHFESISGQDAFVAYPSGSNAGWDLYAPADRDADVAFIDALVESLRGRFNIPEKKVFAIGMSSGGFMVNQLACRRSSLLRGIVSHSGGAPSEPKDPSATSWGKGYVRCAGQNAGTAAMAIHGKADAVVSWRSGDHATNYWAFVNGCTSTRVETPPSPCVRHAGCPTDKPVVFCPVPELGHTFWADAVPAAWAFFSSL